MRTLTALVLTAGIAQLLATVPAFAQREGGTKLQVGSPASEYVREQALLKPSETVIAADGWQKQGEDADCASAKSENWFFAVTPYRYTVQATGSHYAFDVWFDQHSLLLKCRGYSGDGPVWALPYADSTEQSYIVDDANCARKGPAFVGIPQQLLVTVPKGDRIASDGSVNNLLHLCPRK